MHTRAIARKYWATFPDELLKEAQAFNRIGGISVNPHCLARPVHAEQQQGKEDGYQFGMAGTDAFWVSAADPV